MLCFDDFGNVFFCYSGRLFIFYFSFIYLLLPLILDGNFILSFVDTITYKISTTLLMSSDFRRLSFWFLVFIKWCLSCNKSKAYDESTFVFQESFYVLLIYFVATSACLFVFSRLSFLALLLSFFT